ncbi:MAG: sigma-70 family RNA polymerase sigma factor, partial [Candidatus Omnitrophota bacterium]|nr:sigma-70 family RNA polymerase sigma factor [Candidatus Omnitrophota bacterium]
MLIAAFAAQDVAWANPEVFEHRASTTTLQIPSFFSPMDARTDKNVLEMTLQYILKTVGDTEQFKYHLTPKVAGVMLDFEFDKARREDEDTIIPCGAASDRSTRLYEAVIGSDNSIKELRQAKKDRSDNAADKGKVSAAVNPIKELPTPKPAEPSVKIPTKAEFFDIVNERAMNIIALAGTHFIGGKAMAQRSLDKMILDFNRETKAGYVSSYAVALTKVVLDRHGEKLNFNAIIKPLDDKLRKHKGIFVRKNLRKHLLWALESQGIFDSDTIERLKAAAQGGDSRIKSLKTVPNKTLSFFKRFWRDERGELSLPRLITNRRNRHNFDLKATVSYIIPYFKEHNKLPAETELSKALGPTQPLFSKHMPEILAELARQIEEEGFDPALRQEIGKAISLPIPLQNGTDPDIKNMIGRLIDTIISLPIRSEACLDLLTAAIKLFKIKSPNYAQILSLIIQAQHNSPTMSQVGAVYTNPEMVRTINRINRSFEGLKSIVAQAGGIKLPPAIARGKKEKELIEKAIAELEAPDSTSAGLIGKYRVVSDISFIPHNEKDVDNGQIVFTGINIEDPTRQKISISIDAQRAPPGLFRLFRRTKLRRIDWPLEDFLDKFRGQTFLLSPNRYHINGIGTSNCIAIAYPLKNDDIALFHEVAEAADLDVSGYLRRGDLDAYINRVDKKYRQDPAMLQHYALRLFQREMWPRDDGLLTQLIKEIDLNHGVRLKKSVIVKGMSLKENAFAAREAFEVVGNQILAILVIKDRKGLVNIEGPATEAIEDRLTRAYKFIAQLEKEAAVNPAGIMTLDEMMRRKYHYFIENHIKDLEELPKLIVNENKMSTSQRQLFIGDQGLIRGAIDILKELKEVLEVSLEQPVQATKTVSNPRMNGFVYLPPVAKMLKALFAEIRIWFEALFDLDIDVCRKLQNSIDCFNKVYILNSRFIDFLVFRETTVEALPQIAAFLKENRLTSKESLADLESKQQDARRNKGRVIIDLAESIRKADRLDISYISHLKWRLASLKKLYRRSAYREDLNNIRRRVGIEIGYCKWARAGIAKEIQRLNNLDFEYPLHGEETQKLRALKELDKCEEAILAALYLIRNKINELSPENTTGASSSSAIVDRPNNAAENNLHPVYSLLRRLGYPEAAIPAIASGLTQLQDKIAQANLRQKLTAKDITRHISALTELMNLFMSEGYYDPGNPHSLIKALVNGINKGDIFAEIDRSMIFGRRKAGLKRILSSCVSISQLALIILSLAGVNARVAIAPDHAFIFIPLDKNHALFADFTLGIVTVVDLSHYQEEGAYLVLKPEFRISPENEAYVQERLKQRISIRQNELLHSFYFSIQITNGYILIPSLLMNLGSVYYKLGKYAKAIKKYKEAIKLNPKDAEIHYDLGIVYYKLGNYYEATVEYEKAADLNPKHAKARNNLGNIHYSFGSYDKAVKAYKDAISINPGEVMFHNNLGDAYAKLGNYTGAIAEFQKTIELNSGYAGACYNLGKVYYKQGKYNEAIRAWAMAIVSLILELRFMSVVKAALIRQNPESAVPAIKSGVIAAQQRFARQQQRFDDLADGRIPAREDMSFANAPDRWVRFASGPSPTKLEEKIEELIELIIPLPIYNRDICLDLLEGASKLCDKYSDELTKILSLIIQAENIFPTKMQIEIANVKRGTMVKMRRARQYFENLKIVLNKRLKKGEKGEVVESPSPDIGNQPDIPTLLRKPQKTRDDWITLLKKMANFLPEGEKPTVRNIIKLSGGQLRYSTVTGVLRRHNIPYADVGLINEKLKVPALQSFAGALPPPNAKLHPEPEGTSYQGDFNNDGDGSGGIKYNISIPEIGIENFEVQWPDIKRTMEETGEYITPEQERIVFHALHAKNLTLDQRNEIRYFIIEKYRWLIDTVIMKYGMHFYDEQRVADARDEGDLGILRAMVTFEPERGNRFSSYADNWIRNAIQRSPLLRQLIPTSEYAEEKMTRYRYAKQKLWQELERNPTLDEIAREMRISTEKVQEIESDLPRIRSLNISTTGQKKRATMRRNLVPAREEAILTEGSLENLEDYLGKLAPLEEKVIRMRYGLGVGPDRGVSHTLEEIGKAIGVTREWVRRIEAKALWKIRRMMLESRLANDINRIAVKREEGNNAVKAPQNETSPRKKYHRLDLAGTVEYIIGCFKNDPTCINLPGPLALSKVLGPTQPVFSNQYAKILAALKEQIETEGFDAVLRERINKAIEKKVAKKAVAMRVTDDPVLPGALPPPNAKLHPEPEGVSYQGDFKQSPVQEKWEASVEGSGTGTIIGKLSFSSGEKELGYITLQIEKEGISVYSCTGLNVILKGNGLGEKLLLRGLELAKREARNRRLQPKWALVYYTYTGKSDDTKLEALTHILTKLDFACYSIGQDQINDPGLRTLLARHANQGSANRCWFQDLDKISEIQEGPWPDQPLNGFGAVGPIKPGDEVPDFWQGQWSRVSSHLVDSNGWFGVAAYPLVVRNFIIGQSELEAKRQKRKVRIIDLGAGANLYIARKIHEEFTSESLDAEIHALDPARKEDVERLSTLQSVIYHSGQMENPAGIEPNSMDIAVSAFALDYTDMPASLKQINRMLSDDGRAFLVVHHPESDSIEHVRSYLNDIKNAYKNLNQVLEFLTNNTGEIPIYSIRFELGRVVNSTYIYQSHITQIVSQIDDYMRGEENEQARAKLIGEIRKTIDIVKAEIMSGDRLLSNLFTSKRDVKRFFSEEGYEVEVLLLKETKDYDGDGYVEVPEAYGIILTKSAKIDSSQTGPWPDQPLNGIGAVGPIKPGDEDRTSQNVPPLSPAIKKSREALLEVFRNVNQIGTLEEIRAMDRSEFAERLGFKNLGDTSARPFRGFLTYISEKDWIEFKRLRKNVKQGRVKDDREISFSQFRIDGHGFYYDKARIEKWLERESFSAGKPLFVHELLEQASLKAGLTSDMFRYFNDDNLMVLEGELRFASLMGKRDLQIAQKGVQDKIEYADTLLNSPFKSSFFKIFSRFSNSKESRKSLFRIKRSLERLLKKSGSELFHQTSLSLWRIAGENRDSGRFQESPPVGGPTSAQAKSGVSQNDTSQNNTEEQVSESRRAGVVEIRHKKRGILSDKDKKYRDQLCESIYRSFVKAGAQLLEKDIKRYSDIVSNTLVRYDAESLQSLVERDILTTDEINMITERVSFDTAGLVKKVITIIDAYRKASLTDRAKDKLLAHFFTIEEIDRLKHDFPDLQPSIILHACTHNPKDPRAFLRNLIKTQDEISKELEFKDLLPSVILHACTNNPKDPRAFLRNLIKAQAEISKEPEFKDLLPS